MVEAICCHDAHAISGTQIVLLWKSEVLPSLVVTRELFDPATSSKFCTSCIAPTGITIP